MKDMRKLQFLNFLLPLIGFLLMSPPLISIANVDKMIFGFPAIIAFLFTVWMLLIAAAFLFQRHIASLDKGADNKADLAAGTAKPEK
ncbi:hypothetical protein MNBD_ALPHA12-1753 [hydrothermal vent metagenome]|uniref:DUF3311 domain-containing protein n=1 Tax=hydrothermal vent metagenome TaxID=652676 RepID=A0A3B0UIU1_9ZZZZ